MRWQIGLVQIPAPPFGEGERSEWMAAQFAQVGLDAVTRDELGNVFGEIRAQRGEDDESESGPIVLLSAHLDTVFPLGTPLELVLKEDRIEAPGACDNAAGVIGMLAIAHAVVESQMTLGATLVFAGNVGEEGEGDLRGVRHIYQRSRYAGRIAAHIVLDGAGAETAVTQALGSKRFEIRISGPGGHSFTDAGTPNPIAALASALAVLAETALPAQADGPRTTLNIGTIQGGTSVNSIPELATATVDFRSTDLRELVRLEVALHRAVEDAVEVANARQARSSATRTAGPRAKNGNVEAARRLSFLITTIGDRPAAELPTDSPILEALKAVDRHLGLRTDFRLGSTDANIPMALGVPAVSLGAGGEGGRAHTRGEWYSAVNRELGLRRVLLLVLAMVEWAARKD